MAAPVTSQKSSIFDDSDDSSDDRIAAISCKSNVSLKRASSSSSVNVNGETICIEETSSKKKKPVLSLQTKMNSQNDILEIPDTSILSSRSLRSSDKSNNLEKCGHASSDNKTIKKYDVKSTIFSNSKIEEKIVICDTPPDSFECDLMYEENMLADEEMELQRQLEDFVDSSSTKFTSSALAAKTMTSAPRPNSHRCLLCSII